MSDIVERLRGGVDADIGVYPKAVSGYNDERDYEQRDGFKNGWNAAVLQIEGAYEALLGDAATEIENLRRELDITHNMVRNHKERVAELERIIKCERQSGVCVMVHDPDRSSCTPVNCAAMKPLAAKEGGE